MSRYNPALVMVVTIAATLGFVAFLGGNWASNRSSSCYLDAKGHRVCPLAAKTATPVVAPATAPAVQTVSQPATLVERKPLQQQVAQTLVAKMPRVVRQQEASQCPPRTECKPKHRFFGGSGGGIFHRRWR